VRPAAELRGERRAVERRSAVLGSRGVALPPQSGGALEKIHPQRAFGWPAERLLSGRKAPAEEPANFQNFSAVMLRCPAMEQRYFGLLALAVVACGGPSYGSNTVKTPDELIAEQEQLGDQQLKNSRNSADYADTSGPTEDEKQRQWDDKQADLELHRAARSAESCPESVTEDEKDKKGKKVKSTKAPDTKTTVSMVFQNDGHVKSLTLTAPYDDNPVGKCVERAMKAVIVPAYTGPEHNVEYEIDLTGGKKSGPVKTGGDSSDK